MLDTGAINHDVSLNYISALSTLLNQSYLAPNASEMLQ